MNSTSEWERSRWMEEEEKSSRLTSTQHNSPPFESSGVKELHRIEPKTRLRCSQVSFIYTYFEQNISGEEEERAKESATLCGTTLKGKKQVNTQEEGEQNETLVYIWFHSTSTSSSGYVFSSMLCYAARTKMRIPDDDAGHRKRRKLGRSPKLIRFFFFSFLFSSLFWPLRRLCDHTWNCGVLPRDYFLFRCSRQSFPDSKATTLASPRVDGQTNNDFGEYKIVCSLFCCWMCYPINDDGADNNELKRMKKVPDPIQIVSEQIENL